MHNMGRRASCIRASDPGRIGFGSQLHHFLAVLSGATNLPFLSPLFVHEIHLTEFLCKV